MRIMILFWWKKKKGESYNNNNNSNLINYYCHEIYKLTESNFFFKQIYFKGEMSQFRIGIRTK